jgi:hypothetical protein
VPLLCHRPQGKNGHNAGNPDKGERAHHQGQHGDTASHAHRDQPRQSHIGLGHKQPQQSTKLFARRYRLKIDRKEGKKSSNASRDGPERPAHRGDE